MELGLAEASVLVAVITAFPVLIGIIFNARRESKNIAKAAVEKTETDMERVLRERLELRDEQLEHLKSKTAQQQEQITELSERLNVLQQEVHHE